MSLKASAEFTGDGSTAIYSFDFGYLSEDDVSVFVDGVSVSFSFLTASSVTLDSAPAADTFILIQRATPIDVPFADFEDGTPITAAQLDSFVLGTLYVAQEGSDRLNSALTEGATGELDAMSRRIINLSVPISDGDATTKAYVDAALGLDIVAEAAAALVTAEAAALEASEAAAVATAAVATFDPDTFVSKTGSTMTGDLVVSKSAPKVTIHNSGASATESLASINIETDGFNGVISVPSTRSLIVRGNGDTNLTSFQVKKSGSLFEVLSTNDFATLLEAQAGTSSTKVMTPQRTLQEIQKFNEVFHIRDSKAAGTSGGTTVAGSWQTRVLNTTVLNEITGASLASNQFTLPAGTYEIEWYQTANQVDLANKIANITDTSDLAFGPPLRGQSDTSNLMCRGFIKFTIAGSKVFELQYFASTAASDRLGRAVNLGSAPEIYSDVVIRKVG